MFTNRSCVREENTVQNMCECVSEAQWILTLEQVNIPGDMKKSSAVEFLNFLSLPHEIWDASIVLKALARLTECDCEVCELFIDERGFNILRRIIATAATSVEEKKGDATFMSSLEGLLAVIISHNSQQPCQCIDDECKWIFFTEILTIPFLWRYFPGLRYVFVSDTPWIQYMHTLGNRLQLTDDDEFCAISSSKKPFHACLLDNLLEIARISLSHSTCSFDMALDFTNLMSLLVEKSMDVYRDYDLDFQKDNIRTIIMDDELSKEITLKLNSSIFCKLATVLSVAPEGKQDRQLAAWVSLSFFLYHSFHSFIEKECGKEILTELLGTTNIMQNLWELLKVAGMGDSPKILVIFSIMYKHMFLELDDVELFYQMENVEHGNIVTLLKKALWKLLWVIPAKASYPVTVSDQEDADPKIYDRNVSDSSYLEDLYFEDSDSDTKVGAKDVSGHAHLEKKKKKKVTDIKVADDLEVSETILLHVAKHRACLRVSELLKELLNYNNLRPYTPPDDFYVHIEDDVESLFVSKVRPKDQRVRRVLLLAPFLVSFATRLKIFSGKLADKRQPYHGVPFEIHRHQLLKDAFNLFQTKLPVRGLLRHKVSIKFLDENEENEGGVDIGGLFNEFIDNAATTAFSVEHGFFRKNDEGLLYPRHEEKKSETSDVKKVKEQKGTDTSQKGTDTSQKGTDTSQKGTDTSQEGTNTAQEGTNTAQERTNTSQERTLTAEEMMDTTASSSWFSWFSFLGTLLGKALFDEIPVNIQFAPFFLRRFISQRRTCYTKDLLGLNPDLYRYLNGLRKLSDDEFSGMELDFSIDVNKKPVTLTKDGKPMLAENGKPMRVTTINVLDYISVRVSRCLDEEAEAENETHCFLSSFHKVIPKDWISIFDERELQLLISGLPVLDVEYLRKNCKYYGGYDENHQVIMDFWEVLSGFSNEAQIKFLKFVTGLSVVQYPTGAGNSKSVLEIHRLHDDDDSLPTSGTCNNILRLPLYSSKEVLESKLWMAIHETMGFFDGFG